MALIGLTFSYLEIPLPPLPLQEVRGPSCTPASIISVLAKGVLSSPHRWPFLRCFSLTFYFFLRTLAKLPASARRAEEACSSRTDRCREVNCGCQSRSPAWGQLRALQQRLPASATASQRSGQLRTLQTPPARSPGARGVGEAHSSGTAGPGHTRRGEGLQVPWTHRGWEGAMGSGTSRKTKLVKLLLRRLKEETAQEPVPGDSVKQQQDLALPTLEVAENSGEGRLLLTHGQSKTVIGLP